MTVLYYGIRNIKRRKHNNSILLIQLKYAIIIHISWTGLNKDKINDKTSYGIW